MDQTLTVINAVNEQPLPPLIWPDAYTIKAEHLWADYDRRADSFLIYFADHAQDCYFVDIDPFVNVALLLNEDAGDSSLSQRVVGFMVEHFEKEFVPAHPDLAKTWPIHRSHLKRGSGQPFPLHLTYLLLATFNPAHTLVHA